MIVATKSASACTGVASRELKHWCRSTPSGVGAMSESYARSAMSSCAAVSGESMVQKPSTSNRSISAADIGPAAAGCAAIVAFSDCRSDCCVGPGGGRC